MIRFQCPHCANHLTAPESAVGRTTACSQCLAPVIVPGQAPPHPPAPRPQPQPYPELVSPLTVEPAPARPAPGPPPHPAPPGGQAAFYIRLIWVVLLGVCVLALVVAVAVAASARPGGPEPVAAPAWLCAAVLLAYVGARAAERLLGP